ncbi:MAG: aminoglycoside phosphotransferase family protein [Actinomycetota bacterium]
MRSLTIDEVVINKARSVGAESWLDGLPDLVDEIERRWSITVGPSLSGGTEAWVGEAVDDRGRPSVLKLCLPRPAGDPFDEAVREATILELAGGAGCAELYRADLDRGALLIERLGPSMADLDVPYPERLDVLGRVCTELWRPPGDIELPTGADKAVWLADHVRTTWEELDRPCSEAAVEQALAAGERRRRAHDPECAVLVHGDVHQWNTLRADGAPSGWKLIDPDGLVAEPEYDLGILLREDPEESMGDIEAGDPRLRARQLAATTGTDADAVWDWGLIERVSTGLLATRIELQPVGREMLAVADRLADLAP